MRKTILSAFTVCGLFAATSTVEAQGIYFGLRGGAATPTGAFSDATTGSSTALDAAKSGFGYGADAGVGFGIIGLYAGFDQINFDCESANCNTDGKYKLQGVTGGLKLGIPGFTRVRPFIKGGVTFNELQGGYGANSQKLTTEKNPGYEVGVGLDISILGLLSFTPQARYIGQNFKYDVPGVTNTAAQPEQGVNYFTFDLGLSVHNPLKGMRR
jgi:Outer membrane protein beta-barrel domain